MYGESEVSVGVELPVTFHPDVNNKALCALLDNSLCKQGYSGNNKVTHSPSSVKGIMNGAVVGVDLRTSIHAENNPLTDESGLPSSPSSHRRKRALSTLVVALPKDPRTGWDNNNSSLWSGRGNKSILNTDTPMVNIKSGTCEGIADILLNHHIHESLSSTTPLQLTTEQITTFDNIIHNNTIKVYDHGGNVLPATHLFGKSNNSKIMLSISIHDMLHDLDIVEAHHDVDGYVNDKALIEFERLVDSSKFHHTHTNGYCFYLAQHQLHQRSTQQMHQKSEPVCLDIRNHCDRMTFTRWLNTLLSLSSEGSSVQLKIKEVIKYHR